MLRDVVLDLGGQPFNRLFGWGLLGALLVSGVVHAVDLRSCGRGRNSVAIIGFERCRGGA